MRQGLLLTVLLGMTASTWAQTTNSNSAVVITLKRTSTSKKKSYLSNQTDLSKFDKEIIPKETTSIEIVDLENPATEENEVIGPQNLEENEVIPVPTFAVDTVTSPETQTEQPLDIDQPIVTQEVSQPVMDPSVYSEPAQLDNADLNPAVQSPVEATAQPTESLTTTVEPKRGSNAPIERGFRVAIEKPFLRLTVTSQLNYQGTTPLVLEHDLESTGFSVGYAYMPIESIGGTAALSMYQVSDGSSATLAKAEGNIGYTFNKTLEVKAGINGSKFLSGENISALTTGLGGQASIGIKLSNNIGIELGYLEMVQWGQIEQLGAPVLMETREKGYNVGLNTTF